MISTICSVTPVAGIDQPDSLLLACIPKHRVLKGSKMKRMPEVSHLPSNRLGFCHKKLSAPKNITALCMPTAHQCTKLKSKRDNLLIVPLWLAKSSFSLIYPRWLPCYKAAHVLRPAFSFSRTAPRWGQYLNYPLAKYHILHGASSHTSLTSVGWSSVAPRILFNHTHSQLSISSHQYVVTPW